MNTIARMMVLAASAMAVAPHASAQNKTQQQIYEEFKKKAQGDYQSFRKKANEEYAKFLKKAWTTYEAVAPRKKPVEKDVKPVLWTKEDEKKLLNKSLVSREIPVLSFNMPRPTLPQPQPLEIIVPTEVSRVPVVKPLQIGPVKLPDYLKNIKVPVQPSEQEKPAEEPTTQEPTAPEPPAPTPTTTPTPSIPEPPVVVAPTTEPPVISQEEPTTPVEDVKPDSRYVVFNTFGTECRVRFEDRDFSFGGKLTGDGLSAAWTKFAGSEMDNTLYDCLQIRKQLHLSDWAYYLMLKSFAEKCFGKSNEATFLHAYLYCQSGYKMRLGRSGDKLYLLVGSKHIIYGKMFHYVGGEDFYSFDSKEPRLQICDVGFPKEQPMSLYISDEQLFADNPTPVREIKSKRYKDMSFKVSINKNLLDFFDTYPASEIEGNPLSTWEMYARNPLASSVKAQLYPAIMEHIKGLSQADAVNKLLNWVQTGFEYEYDDKVWGHDRAFFAEESLYYPYCDCEDRSILLSHLVRELIGLDVVLVYYPGHLASAVAFTEDVKGDYISYNGKKFVICDGTYIGAPLGMTMPGMDNQKAKVILLEAAR